MANPLGMDAAYPAKAGWHVVNTFSPDHEYEHWIGRVDDDVISEWVTRGSVSVVRVDMGWPTRDAAAPQEGC